MITTEQLEKFRECVKAFQIEKPNTKYIEIGGLLYMFGIFLHISALDDNTRKENEMKAKHGFDYAIQRVKEGYRMKREGWNGKDQYIDLATNVSFATPSGEVVNVDHKDMGNKAIAFHGTSGVQLGWLASQSDMLADDWVEA